MPQYRQVYPLERCEGAPAELDRSGDAVGARARPVMVARFRSGRSVGSTIGLCDLDAAMREGSGGVGGVVNGMQCLKSEVDKSGALVEMVRELVCVAHTWYVKTERDLN